MADAKIVVRADDRASGVIDGVRRRLGGISTASNALRGSLSLLSPALVGAFSAAGLVAFAKAANDGLLKIKDLSEATGATISNVSALENVARAAGGSIDDVSGVLVKFNDALKNAERTKEVGAALKALGLEAAALKRLDPAEALRQVAVALERFEDNGNKARLTQELFSRSVRQAAPFLKELAEQTQLTGTVTEAAVIEADKFNKELARFRQNAEDAARVISGPLVRAFNELSEATRTNGIAGFFDALNNSALGRRLGVDDVSRYRREIDSLTETLRRLESAQAGARSDNRARYQPEIDATRAELQRVQREFYRLTDVQGGRGSIIPGLARPSLPEVSAGGGGGTRSGRPARQEFRSAILDPFEEQRQAFLQTEKDYDGLDRILQQLGDTSRELGTAILDPLEAQKQAFLQTEKDYEGVEEALDRLKDKSADASDLARDLGLTFSSAFEDAIVEGRKLSDVLRGLEQDILRLVTRKLVTEPLGNAISGFLGGGQPGGGGFLDSVGSFFSNIFGGFFADGGYLRPGQIGIAGERGPELIYGGRSGLTVQPSGAGAVSVTINQTFARDTSMRTVQQAAAQAGEAVQRALARNR